MFSPAAVYHDAAYAVPVVHHRVMPLHHVIAEDHYPLAHDIYAHEDLFNHDDYLYGDLAHQAHWGHVDPELMHLDFKSGWNKFKNGFKSGV